MSLGKKTYNPVIITPIIILIASLLVPLYHADAKASLKTCTIPEGYHIKYPSDYALIKWKSKPNSRSFIEYVHKEYFPLLKQQLEMREERFEYSADKIEQIILQIRGFVSNDTNSTKSIENSINTSELRSDSSVGSIDERKTDREDGLQKFEYDCYYCDNYQTNVKTDYEIHVIQKHTGKVCYTNKSSLEQTGIEGKGKPWEI